MRDSGRLGAKESTEREDGDPLLTINHQWSLGPIASTAQPTKHKSVLKKRERKKERKKG